MTRTLGLSTGTCFSDTHPMRCLDAPCSPPATPTVVRRSSEGLPPATCRRIMTPGQMALAGAVGGFAGFCLTRGLVGPAAGALVGPALVSAFNRRRFACRAPLAPAPKPIVITPAPASLSRVTPTTAVAAAPSASADEPFAPLSVGEFVFHSLLWPS